MTDQAVAVNRPPLVVLRKRLEDRIGELRTALPSEIKPEQFIRAVISAAQHNPEILACEFRSLWLACMLACRDGLLPDGIEGAIVPYRDRATWIPMYQGLLRRFRRSGQFKRIKAGIVRQGERFEYWIDGDDDHFLHVPGDNIEAPIVKVYAIARTKDGGFFAEVLPIAEANKIRNMSRSTREDGPWKKWPEEMYKKTALRRLSKYLPSARDLMPDEIDVEPIGERLAAQRANEQEPRSSGPAAALEQFAGDASASTFQPLADRGGGDATANSESSPHEAYSATRDLHTADPASIEATSEAEQAKRDAYARGQEAKSQGQKRSAVPGEYREGGLAGYWVAGWHGEPFPDPRQTADQRNLDLKES